MAEISEKLREAREYEKKYMQFADAERPAFHVTGPIGWINDPNGFSYYKGEVHLFFQYYPYDTKWGPMHWGHVKTRDFIRWEYLPCALAPDSSADDYGCFSGSAVEMPDGRHLLMYTGVVRRLRDDAIREEIQQQCIAIGDGVDYVKYEGNPVLTSKDLPADASQLDFRDPRIWREDDGYYAVVGNRPADGSGSILLFHSEDGLHWNFRSILDACFNEYGKMWECPDFFPLDGKHVLLVSPQEMIPLGLEFHAGYGTVALIGTFDKEKGTFERENVHAIDYGIDFYAPQTVDLPDGRRIMIAWMQNWTNVQCQQRDIRIFGSMTLPRELRVVDGRLYQLPVRELEAYRGRKVSYNNVMITRETNLTGVSGRTIDMTVKIRPAKGKRYSWFKLKMAKDGEHYTSVRYKPDDNIVRIDRTRSGGRYDIVHVRDILASDLDGVITLRIILDNNSVELFINDGEQAATWLIYSPRQAVAISFEADAPAVIDVEKYDLNVR